MRLRFLIQSCLAVVFFLSGTTAAQEKPDEGKVSIPWEEFRKLLELDKDEITLSWEEFQKILVQTGGKYLPPFQMKEETVVLTREQFKKLLDQMKPPVISAITPPADFLITKAKYQGKMTENNVLFRADFSIEIFPKEREQFLKIPLFPQNIALKDVLFDGKQALVILENNQHVLTTNAVGRHDITVDLSLKTSFDQGPRSFSLPIPITPITSLDLDIPLKKIEVEIANAQHLETSMRAGLTHVFALLAPSSSIDVKWRKELPEAIKGPAKIYADSINHIVIEDDALRVNAEVSLAVLQNTIPSLTLKIPEGYSILNVQGSGLGDWRELEREGAKFLEIPFDYAKKGNFTITVTAEKLLPEDSMAADFTGFPVNDTIRQKGFLGVELKGASEVTVSNAEGLDRLDVSELPAKLINRSQKPLLFGFKYLHHPYALVLDIKKHKKLPIISTVVDSASGVTLFTEDGKLVHRIIYQIRNTSKQFLELQLPQDAQVWSVFVGGEPATPRINESKVLIPLNRSRQGTSGLVAFDVELIYYEKSEKFGCFDRREIEFPVPDIIISQMLWSVYLPVGYTYINFGGTVEKEQMAKGIWNLLRVRSDVITEIPAEPPPPSAKPGAGMPRVRKSKFSPNVAISEEELAVQAKKEMEFNRRVQQIQEGKGPQQPGVTGVLSIRINIPTTGQLYRFAKTIVSDEPLTLNFTFASQGATRTIEGLVLIILLLILYFLRKRIQKLYQSIRERYQAKHLPLILLVLAVILWAFSKVLSIILFVVFVALFYKLWFKRSEAG
jgi:hypothetical protein